MYLKLYLFILTIMEYRVNYSLYLLNINRIFYIDIICDMLHFIV